MSTFKIIKKGANNFWHWFNNDAKKVSISSFAVVLDEVSQTFSIVYLNGANVPQQAVNVLNIEVIDETDTSDVETFTNVIDLRARLVELGYTAYLIGGGIDNITGLISEGTNVTITGDGTLANPYVISASGSGGGGAVDSVNGQVGVVVLDADDISDTSTTKKFVTTTEKNAWNSKEPQITEGTTSQYFRGDKTFQTLNKSSVNLSDVDNTSDVNKPVSNATQTALDLKANKSTTPIILKNNFNPNTLTAPITTETIVDNYDLGVGFLAVGESLNLYAELVKNVAVSGTANSFIYLSKVSNSIAVSDAVRIATSNPLSTGSGSNYIERTFHRKSSSILSGRIGGTTLGLTDKVSIKNIPQNIINDATLSDYRFLIVTSTYSGTSAPNTMQTNIILTKNPVT